MSVAEKPLARPLFRKLALGVAVVCFALAVAGLASPGDGLFGPLVCLAVGFVLAVVGAAGYWPPRHGRCNT
jgi:hypothetical protein